MMLYKLLFGRALSILVALAWSDAAFAQTIAPDHGDRPATLAAATASASGAPGWRSVSLANGSIAAIGIGAAGGTTHVIGIACGAGKVPEIVATVRGAGLRARALMVETTYTVMAFPLDSAGSAAVGTDALLGDASSTEDAKFQMRLDDQPFSATGAREALAQVGKDCERRGWQYGNDHERQLVWMYTEYPDEPPALVFGKPATGWLLANVTCDQGRKSLIIKSTVLPDRPKTGQIMPLTIRVADQDYSASGQVEMLDGGDVPGFLVANFDQPRPLLDKLRDAQQLTMSAKSRRMQISARGIGPLLPRFEKACGLSQ